LMDLLKRPELTYADVAHLKGDSLANEAAAEQVEIEAKYSGYIERQQEDVNRLRAYENTIIPDDFDYSQVDGLSNEVKQKLIAARPQTLARASRISGVTPAAISLVLVYLKKRGVLKRLKDNAHEQQAS
jgi:tRNA uridine 5-carboxymethylaminomethyl modification enzyme